ncbi:acyl-CoA dehydrogenase family protein [Nocardioides sp. QY071]|uniref:acyl-CoA dehydrogenase family protein n=1 Tax=Nocardioides sp. QY071 TaxID=3044187 RepID=UPI002499C98F|nr:acyl-CoA dehydrogenase family protein [Nocardioides sp. QY071]WGY00452.1 acyl-CoA dehydrogenase family protein [Nocardioides sp. QY071]
MTANLSAQSDVDLRHSDRSRDLQQQLGAFMDEYVYPAERAVHHEIERLGPWARYPTLLELRAKAKSAGLWNLFMPAGRDGDGLTNLEYAPLAEIMGRVLFGAEVFNCSAPDSGNMETLHKYGTPQHQARWLSPLLEGTSRSAFAMTEPDAASSDATAISSSIVRDGDEYVINGRKWYTSGATHPDCEIMIFMGRTDPAAERHRQQSMVLVPRNAEGVRVVRALPVLGSYLDRACEVWFDDVRVPVENVLLGEGRGFEIAQGRLGPGRMHHCMRLIGLSERVLERMCRRVESRSTFGRPIAEQTVTLERIAEARLRIEQARLLTVKAAWMMDTVGNSAARQEIAMIKVAAPAIAQQVVDWAIQAFGGAGLTNDFLLSTMYANARSMRLLDGPDEVHRNQIGRIELQRQRTRSNEEASAQVLCRDEVLVMAEGGVWPRPAEWPRGSASSVSSEGGA